MAFPETFLQELKSRCELSDVAAPYVDLKRSGRTLAGLCPFHGEKTPSFHVYPEDNHFYCFGCGAGGDVISFIMRIENLDYVEAVRLLAQRAGLDMPQDGYDDSLSKLRRRIFEANREAARFFYRSLYRPVGREGLGYLHSRMLSDRTIRHFGLGFADDEWSSLTAHLKGLGFSENELLAANLSVRRANGNGIHDRFMNRVIFPIIDLRGNVIAFGGRIMTDQKPKYLNTSDTPVFKKSANLFSLNNAKNSGSRTLLLCEGYMDVIAVSQAGFANAVATLGTALTGEQAMLMKRYADEVIICYDADGAGQKATARAIPILRNAGLTVRVLTVPEGKDPDEFIKSKGADGAEAFRALIERSGNDIDYRLQKLRADYNLAASEGKVGYLEAAAQIIASVSSPIERDVYSSKLCREFGVDKAAFNSRLEKLGKSRSYQEQKKQQQKIRAELSGRGDKFDSDRAKARRSSSAEEALVAYLINNPDSHTYISERVSPEQFQNSLMRRYYTYFLGRIADGKDPLNNTTSDFSAEENNRIYRILTKYSGVACTRRSLDEYINVIKGESVKLSAADAANMSDEELNAYLDKIRKAKGNR